MKRRAILGGLGTLLVSCRGRPAPPTGTTPRLVSLTPAITETVLSLGGAARLVGVSDYCVLPPGLKLPRLGSSLTPSFEAIAGLRPSLILCDDSAGAKRRELAALATCQILPWLTLSEVVQSTRSIGHVLDNEAAANALAERLNSRLSRRPPPGAPRALLLLSYDPDRPADIWFIRRNSLHGAALAAAGAENAVAHDVAGLPRLSVEELMQLDPDDVLIIPPPGSTLERRLRLVSAFSALAPLRAVNRGRVGVVTGGSQSVGPSILGLVDALTALLQKMAGPPPISALSNEMLKGLGVKLRLEDISVVRKGRALLDHLSVTLEPGQLLSLVGPNGAGKTTLLRAALGLTRATGGSIWVGDVDVQTLAPKQRAARLAWLPQHSSAAEELSALEIVIAARFRFDEAFAHSASEASKALTRVGVGELAQRPLGTLSGGERQRVALAGLLAQAAPILLVDEPANHLDPAQQIDVYRLLGELWQEGASIICVTHDVNLLRHLGRPQQVRVAGVAQGKLCFECPLSAPELPEKLGALFGVTMHALSLGGQRVLLPERAP